MYRLLLAINDWMNRTQYDAALRSWTDQKRACDEHNQRARAAPTFPFDAFAYQKLKNPGPPPDVSKYMNRSLSDNCCCLVLLGVAGVCIVGYCLFRVATAK